MKIRMKETSTGADDGIHILLYEKGKEYDLSEDLAENFLKQGIAELTKTEIPKKIIKEVVKQISPVENKKVEPYKNKRFGKK